jgi:proteasome lid subunit RPN8/RPN11
MPAFNRRLLDRLLRRPPALLAIDHGLWADITAELASRGAGVRESGAFLLGYIEPHRPREVLSVVYYDDLDADCLTGGISFDGAAYGRLWDICGEHDLRVVADVHTHPGGSVSQSTTDRDHPMIARAEHVGLIVPDYAEHPIAASEVGIHQYHGDGKWTSWLGRDTEKRLLINSRRQRG